MAIEQKHLTDYLKLHAASKKNKPALMFEGETLNWSQLWKRVEDLGGYFAELLGSNEQKVVDILLTNSTDFVVVYLAILHAGHIALPLDPAYKKLEIDAIINQVPPELIVTDERYSPQIGHHKTVKLMTANLWDKKVSKAKLLRMSAAKQIASLTFTSGTTGRPKTVPNTHSNQIWSIQACSKVWNWTSEDSLLITLPLSHWYGLVMGLAGAIYHGNTLYLHQQSFDAKDTLKTLASGNVSIFTHVPLAYMKILAEDQKHQYDLSKVRLCISGSAPLPPAVWQRFKDQYGVEIIETYGSSETGRIAANRLGNPALGSPGQILPGVDMKLSAEGEVQIKSPGVFPGYYHNETATNADLTEDGYWRTGDIAEQKDGNLYLRGRVQEKIRRFGYSISPRDVEWAMYQNPQIKEVYVMGNQSDGPNDELIYFIVSDLSDQQIEAYYKENLIFAWRPDRIIRLPKIPRTPLGKPQMGKLKELVS